MASDQARNRLYMLVRSFAEQAQAWELAVRYFSKPDERFDMTLASQRIYGRRTEAMVIQAAAGLDSPEAEMTERDLVLPTSQQLRDMKVRAGFNGNEIA